MSTDQSNIDTRGGDLVGVAIGGSGNQVNGSKTTLHGSSTGAPITLDQVMERLGQLEQALQGSTMTNELRVDTLSNVAAAREALGRETPNVKRAGTMMEGTLDELSTAGRSESLASVVALATAIVEMLKALAA
jgi:hypothetical protein